MNAITPEPARILDSMGWAPTAPPRQVSGGWDNHLWRFETADGRSHVLRVYRHADGHAQARASNEAAAMDAARTAGLPVAISEAIGQADGAPAFIQQWMPGVPLLEALKRRPWQLRRLAHQFGALQARIHRISPPPGVRRLDAGAIRTTIDHAPLADALERTATIDALCHLDYHPLNVLAENGQLTAVLDWTAAAVTDRRADLAFTETALLRIPLPPSPANPALTRLRRLLHRYWCEGYRAHAGDFPLTPLFQAASVVAYLADLEAAAADGRGWATGADVISMQVERDLLLRVAGL